MFDYHVHSHFSPDADMSMEEGILSAISKGVKELAFTDHIDYDYDGDMNHILFNYKNYLAEINYYREKFQGRINIKVGVEFGLQPHILHKYVNDFNKLPFDFVIASIHSVEKQDLYTGNFFDKKSQVEAYHCYFADLMQCISNFHDFSVVGHLDVIKRYGGFDIPLPLDEYKDVSSLLLKKIIEKGKGIELNTSGIRYKLGDYHPALDVFQLYYHLGGEIITIGSDAHKTHHIAFEFKNALKDLNELGFKYVCTFEKMKPKYHKIIDLI